MVQYGLNEIKLAFDVQYKIVILRLLYLLTYLVALASKVTCLALALALKMLAWNPSLANTC